MSEVQQGQGVTRLTEREQAKTQFGQSTTEQNLAKHTIGEKRATH